MRLRWFSLAFGALLFVACADGDPTAPVSRPFTLRVGETVTIRGAGFSVKLVGVVNDTRCPFGAPCCFECVGNAQIQLQVIQFSPADLTLNTHDSPRTAVITVQYELQVTGLTPSRTVAGDPKQSEYRVSLVVLTPGPV